MRGRKAGHHCESSRAAAAGRARGSDAPSILSDIDEHFPVTAEELDVLEAFLTAEMDAFLAGPDKRHTGGPDSEAPQRNARDRQARESGAPHETVQR
jgi:hypothetical protein